jgi:hypothetical protein
LRAADLGRTLKTHIAKIPHAREYPINLIGHSLGARVIHWALYANDWSDYRLKDCVLLGGAADGDDNDWPDCVREISGKIYNAYSRSDHALALKLFERTCGRFGINWTHSRIVNRMYSLGHCEYWENLEYVLTHLWKGFRQTKTSLLACPECEGSGKALCEECDDRCKTECEDCDGTGTYDCDECDGGKLMCPDCEEGEVWCDRCNGEGTRTCGHCGGDGCGHCNHDGALPCRKCGGERTLDCGTCGGDGTVDCETCEGDGNLYCETCDGWSEVNCESCDDYGQVDCEACDGTGEFWP